MVIWLISLLLLLLLLLLFTHYHYFVLNNALSFLSNRYSLKHFNVLLYTLERGNENDRNNARREKKIILQLSLIVSSFLLGYIPRGSKNIVTVQSFLDFHFFRVHQHPVIFLILLIATYFNCSCCPLLGKFFSNLLAIQIFLCVQFSTTQAFRQDQIFMATGGLNSLRICFWESANVLTPFSTISDPGNFLFPV